jgi:GNAT superfamily N-acetyltransferase
MAEPQPIERLLELRDGTPVLIRPIGPDDKERLHRGFLRLSARTRYRRFGAPVKDLTDEQLVHLTDIDYRNHMAWMAVDPASPERPALGVARYVRLTDEPDVAEAAVVVADEFQGRGLGSLLLGMLAVAAIGNGIHRFRAYVLYENTPMLDMLRDVGGTVELEEPGLCRVDLPLAADPDDLPDTPTGRAFKAVAKKVLPPPAVLRRTVVRGSGDPA